ncbi:NlpC/P60 family protein [Phreatobacter oligotrophus]|uniref:C40 family peptidase n=1 Tax=Phreatobacter oligotrophus TaxID=1122261 RepID=UPI002355CB26|nr:NlpC/P60 family protein [Phreatobacter oligotrophus]MBX9990066.1 C40 family peptidase [Phreatobacter oligotrophus]
MTFTLPPGLDRRLTPARADLAAAHLRGQVDSARFVEGRPMRTGFPVVPLAPSRLMNAARDTEFLLGEEVTIFDEDGGFVFVQSDRDGYVGYAVAGAFRPRAKPATHRVAVMRTHLYPGPSIKLPPTFVLHRNSLLTIERFTDAFAVTDTGAHVIASHLKPVAEVEPDFVTVAEDYLGSPYLWAGRTSFGLDCSGLVQTAFEACGIAVPRDTDMQEKAIGEPVAFDGDVTVLRRGDLIFWKGHVGIVSGPDELLHANGHHMMVVKEPLSGAIARIREKSYGDVTSVRRPAP